jgi:CUG-BP- and ETR3-like factor
MEQPELKEVMSEFGKVVDMMILRDRMSGTHKGCAFVRFELEAEGNLALESLHGKRKLANVRTRHNTAPPSLAPRSVSVL